MSVVTAVQLAILAGSFIYHRYKEQTQDIGKTNERLQIGQFEEGSTIPLLYGRCRVRQPVIPWLGNATAEQGITPPYPEGLFIHEAGMMFVLGIPFADGTTLLQGIYIGEERRADVLGEPDDFAPNLQAGGTLPHVLGHPIALMPSSGPDFTQFFYEFGSGLSTQTMVGSHFEAAMVTAGLTYMPAFRGYATVYGFVSRNNASLPAIGFEVSSYPADPLVAPRIFAEANPADVLYDLLTGAFGKLGLDPALIDLVSFTAVATTLIEEVHGYSRAFESAMEANDIIEDVLRQIDGVLYYDRTANLIKLKLIRADYVLSETMGINPDNCEAIQNPAFGGFTGILNKIRAVYQKRSDDYRDGSATAQNQANAVGQDGYVREGVFQYHGVCTQELAETIAARELVWRSRPIAKCTAIVNRSFLRTVPGDVVTLTWPEWGISDLVMRVAAVSHGTLENGKIVLDLIQDASYVHRSTVFEEVVAPFPTEAA